MRDLSSLDWARIALPTAIWAGEDLMGDAHNGAFVLRLKPGKTRVLCIAGSGSGWDHVSVSVRNERRLPTWGEMAYLKGLFFEDDEAAMELHPPRAQWINNAEVLHLWRPHDVAIPLPPAYMVGLPGVSPEDMPAMVRRLQADARARRALEGRA
jgi:hypothetical protein